MGATLLQSPERNQSIDGPVDVFMHVWPVHNGDETGRDLSWEVELLASHTRNPNHLDHCCPACQSLRLGLESIARTVVQQLSPTMMGSLMFDIYSDFASIICSPTAGPSVRVSIEMCQRTGADSTLNGSSDAVAQIAQIKEALRNLGVRER